MFKIPKQEYRAEFKELAVKRLKGGERVERLMRENNIRGRHKWRYKATTDAKHSQSVAPNLLNRNFTPVAPNQAWRAWSDLDLDGRRLAVSGRRARTVQQGNRWLVDQAKDGGGHRHGCVEHGLVAQEAGAGSGSSL